MIRSTLSKTLNVDIGSPQGALVLPTIYLIMTAYISMHTNSVIESYADDIVSTINDPDTTILTRKCEL